MARITVEDSLHNIPNLFQLVLVAAKRARKLANGAEATVELPSHTVDRPGTSMELLVDMTRAVFVDPATDKVLRAA